MLWEDDDPSILFTMPHYEIRAAIDFKPDDGELQPNMTLYETHPSEWTFGMNAVFNDTATREM